MLSKNGAADGAISGLLTLDALSLDPILNFLVANALDEDALPVQLAFPPLALSAVPVQTEKCLNNNRFLQALNSSAVLLALLISTFVVVASRGLLGAAPIWIASDPVSLVFIAIVELVGPLPVAPAILEASLVDPLDHVDSATVAVFISHVTIALGQRASLLVDR